MVTTHMWHEERQFGRTVGAILVVLAAWFAYRDRLPTAVPLLVGAGSLLIIFGVVWPRALARPYRAWMALAEVLAFVSSRIILAAVFLLIVMPIGFVMRRTRWDPLQRRAAREPSYWRPYATRHLDAKHYERMF